MTVDNLPIGTVELEYIRSRLRDYLNAAEGERELMKPAIQKFLKDGRLEGIIRRVPKPTPLGDQFLSEVRAAFDIIGNELRDRV